MKEKATIFDYARMCRFYDGCNNCPFCGSCTIFMGKHPDKANEIIIKWYKEHPVETRQSKFLEILPKAKTDNDGVLVCCPKWADKDFRCNMCTLQCDECRKEYWLAEVDENE